MSKRGIILFALVFSGAAILSLWRGPSYSAAAVKPTRELCMECHPKAAAMMDKADVHRPVKEGRCTACHNPHTSRHSGLLKGSGGELCFNCHPKAKYQAAFVHKPVEEGKCSSCHSPHSSANAFLLKDVGVKLCYGCHPQDKVSAKKNVHPEIRQGNCTVCHSPHASGNDGLLVKEKTRLCASCHYPSPGGKAAAKPCAYEVAGSDCTGCHSPHSSDRGALLKASLHKPFAEKKCSICHTGKGNGVKQGTALCFECHKPTLDSFKKINSHLIQGPGKNACTSCHNPHASDEKSLLADKDAKVCYRCHADTKASMAKSKYLHSGIERCADCHVSHGSNNKFFLSSGSETCSTEKCHPGQGRFTHPVGEKIIDPRSKSPMDCGTCHNPMGSPEKFILRFEKDKDLCVQCHQV
ncbi:MAG: cytochrome c3 family protein [Deltaproteobacteria bacterium]